MHHLGYEKKNPQYLVPATLNYDFKIKTKSMIGKKIIVEWTRLGQGQLSQRLLNYLAIKLKIRYHLAENQYQFMFKIS